MAVRWLRAVRRPWRELRAGLIDTLFRPCCAGCGRPGDLLCEVCDWRLRRRGGGCPRCGEPVVPGRGCPAGHEALRNLTGLVAPFRYAGSGGRVVRRFKLDGDPAAGLFLASAMRRAWRGGPFEIWRRILVIPVPLHPKKLRQRGFDQADWLAQRLHRHDRRRRWDVVSALERVRDTLGQGDPRTTNRERNVRDAFSLRGGVRVAGRRIVLVDDVFTSGATMRECARLLRHAGAAQVVGLTACRA